jgi:hypothetical protein
VNTVLDDLHDWHGVDFDEALRHSFSRVMQHAKKRSVISAHRSGDERDNEKDAQCSANSRFGQTKDEFLDEDITEDSSESYFEVGIIVKADSR